MKYLPRKQQIKSGAHRFLTLLCLVVVVASSQVVTSSQRVSAITPGDVYSINNNTSFYEPGCGSFTDDTSATAADPVGAADGTITIDGPFKPKATPKDKVNEGDAYKGNASTFGSDPSTGYNDPGAGETQASGISNSQPGIAVYNEGTLKGWWKVIAPNGKSAILQQTDVGPSTPRIVDVTSVAARSVFGYKEGNAFPTDQGDWKLEYAGKTKPAGATTKDSGGSGDSIPDSGAATGPSASTVAAVTQCCNGSGALNVSAGTGAPDGATFPNLDPSAMASAIDKYINQVSPNSDLKGTGATIVASAKKADVSPFLIVAIAQKESALADPSVFNVAQGHNAFGRSAAAGQPSFQGSRAWYKWSSGKASVDYTAAENSASGSGGDQAAFLRAVYADSLKANDFVALLMKYAPPVENDTSTYISQVKSWVKKLVDLTGGGAGATDTTTTASTTAPSGVCCPPDSSVTPSGDAANTNTGAAGKPNFIDLSGPPVNGVGMGQGKMSKIDTLVIHYTQDSQEGAGLRKNDFGSSGLGIQFNVGKTGKIYQYFPLDAMQETYHAKAVNGHSIGIEITGRDGEALINNAAQFKSVAATATYLCDYYKIPCGTPKGDFSGSSAAEAQGMIGHDEAPSNDHSDPDTKIIGANGQINIATGKSWTDADRKDTSKHAYMMKLRQAMGFDPTPGSSTGSSATPADTTSTASNTACPDSSAPPGAPNSDLVWPFATKSDSQYNRIDQGWDIQDKAGANIYAIASGKLNVFQPDTGNFGNDYPTQELDSSIGGPSKWIYYGHVHIIPSLKGKHVEAGQLIAHANVRDGDNGSGAPPGWLEIGFAQPGTDAPTDSCNGVPACAGVETAAGKKIKSILVNTKPGSGGN